MRSFQKEEETHAKLKLYVPTSAESGRLECILMLISASEKKEFIQAANRMSSSNYYSSILRHRTMLNLINLCIILCCTLQRFHFFPLIYICIRNFQSEAKNIVKICWLLLSCRSLFTLSLLFVPYTFGSASQEKKF